MIRREDSLIYPCCSGCCLSPQHRSLRNASRESALSFPACPHSRCLHPIGSPSPSSTRDAFLAHPSVLFPGDHCRNPQLICYSGPSTPKGSRLSVPANFSGTFNSAQRHQKNDTTLSRRNFGQFGLRGPNATHLKYVGLFRRTCDQLEGLLSPTVAPPNRGMLWLRRLREPFSEPQTRTQCLHWFAID